MREIEFRGKREDNGEWAYGAYIPPDRGRQPHAIRAVETSGTFHHKVVPETIGQYAGVKDKSGRKIFEGDVVEDDFGNIGVITYLEQFFDWRIVFFKGRENLVSKNGARILDWTWPKIALKVIGNIHDDPELLKGGE